MAIDSLPKPERKGEAEPFSQEKAVLAVKGLIETWESAMKESGVEYDFPPPRLLKDSQNGDAISNVVRLHRTDTSGFSRVDDYEIKSTEDLLALGSEVRKRIEEVKARQAYLREQVENKTPLIIEERWVDTSGVGLFNRNRSTKVSINFFLHPSGEKEELSGWESRYVSALKKKEEQRQEYKNLKVSVTITQKRSNTRQVHIGDYSGNPSEFVDNLIEKLEQASRSAEINDVYFRDYLMWIDDGDERKQVSLGRNTSDILESLKKRWPLAFEPKGDEGAQGSMGDSEASGKPTAEQLEMLRTKFKK